jgi:hypothetical protein
MNKSRPVILIFCITAGIGLLAAVNFIPALKNASGPGRVFEWAAVCLLGAIAVGIGLVTGHNYTAPSAAPGSWRKHRPAKEILSTVPISDMLRAERQFVLYGESANLLVLLTLLMYGNKQNEAAIRRNLIPLIAYRDDSIWKYLPGFLVKAQKQRQFKQRSDIVKNVLAAIENRNTHNHTNNNRQVPHLTSANLNHPPEINETAGNIVRTIIRLHTEGRRSEDISEALNTGSMNLRGGSNTRSTEVSANRNI